MRHQRWAVHQQRVRVREMLAQIIENSETVGIHITPIVQGATM